MTVTAVRRRYSALRHLAVALWLNHDPRRCWMGVFMAYFDASGTPDQGVSMFVSGFVSSEAKWLKFESRWLRLLNQYEIESPFHMKDFAASIKQYASWKDDKPRRARFMEEAIGIIKRHTRKSFSSGIMLSDFRDWRAEYVIPEYLCYPFVLCSFSVIREVANWIKRNNVLEKMALVFEDGDKHKGKLYDALVEHGLGYINPNFVPKQQCVPFQAADLLAWEHARLAKDALTGTGRPLRGSMATLERVLPHDGSWRLHTQKSLTKFCEQQGFPKRAQA